MGEPPFLAQTARDLHQNGMRFNEYTALLKANGIAYTVRHGLIPSHPKGPRVRVEVRVTGEAVATFERKE